MGEEEWTCGGRGIPEGEMGLGAVTGGVRGGGGGENTGGGGSGAAGGGRGARGGTGCDFLCEGFFGGCGGRAECVGN